MVDTADPPQTTAHMTRAFNRFTSIKSPREIELKISQHTACLHIRVDILYTKSQLYGIVWTAADMNE